jgi:DnaJ-class molecular chaperone
MGVGRSQKIFVSTDSLWGHTDESKQMRSNRKCKGKGVQLGKVQQSVHVIKGTDSGTIIKVRKMGQGDGDLLIQVKVRPHHIFKRKGYDIHSEVTVTKKQL